jgi:NitT/TauT family transport system substrate-binding protein
MTSFLKGYFQDNGIELTYEKGFGGADSITKIASGQYDLGDGDPNSMIEFNYRNPDNPLIAIYIRQNRSPFGLYVLKDSGITHPSQLSGKRLGAPVGDALRRLWKVFANQIGIDPDSVEWITMQPQLREPFLIQGRVDAITGFITSSIPNLVRNGINPREIQSFYYNDFGLSLYGNAVITRRDAIRDKPHVLQGFLNAYLKELKDSFRNIESNFLLLIDELRSNGQLVDVSTERFRLSLAMDLFIAEEVRTSGLGGINQERMEKAISQVAEGIDLSISPDVDDVFYDGLLPPLSDRMLLDI